MKRITLCDLANDANHYAFDAEITKNCLTLIGEMNQSQGASEYYYFLDEENTNKVFTTMHAKANDLEALKTRFHGLKASQEFREFCNAHKIRYAYHNIA